MQVSGKCFKMAVKLETKDIIVITIIIVAAFVAAGLSVYQYIDGVNTDIEAKKLQQKVITTQEKLIKAQEHADIKAVEMNSKLEVANKELQSKTEELIQSQKKLIEVQNESLKNITGFGFAEVNVHPKENEFFIHSKSDYNMFGITIEVIDYDKMKVCGQRIINHKIHFSTNCLEKNSRRNTIKTLNSNTYADLNYKLDLTRAESHYITKIISKNITTMQYSIFFYKKASNEFIHYYKIFEITRDKKEYVLLSESPIQPNEDEWTKRFPYKENFVVD
jgi:hypothetical protein